MQAPHVGDGPARGFRRNGRPEPGPQVLPWQLPMPARVRSFTSLMSVRPSRTASRISAALTFSQRQTVTSSGTAYRSLRGENHASRKALDAVCTARERSRGALRRLNSSGPMPSCRSATARPASSPAIPATAAPRTRLQSPATYTPSRAVLPQSSQAHGPALLARIPMVGQIQRVRHVRTRDDPAVVQQGRGFQRVRRTLGKEGNALKAIRTLRLDAADVAVHGRPALPHVVEHGQAPEQQGQAEQPRREVRRGLEHVAGRRLIQHGGEGVPLADQMARHKVEQGAAAREHHRRFRKQAAVLRRCRPPRRS